MRTFIIIVVILLGFINSISSQKTIDRFETESIIEPQSYYLASKTRSLVESTSRVVIPIKVPPNTVEWFYLFTTSPGEQGAKNLNLGIQVASMLSGNILISKIGSKLEIPPGSSAINTSVVNRMNRDLFISGSSYSPINQKVTYKSIMQGKIEVDFDKDEIVFITLENPNFVDATYVNIEVIAVTKFTDYVDEWNTDEYNKLREKCMDSFNSEISKAKRFQICECLSDNVTNSYTPSEWEVNKNKSIIIELKRDECYSSTNNLDLRDFENETSASIDEVYSSINASAANLHFEEFGKAKKNLIEAIAIIELNEIIRKDIKVQELIAIYNSLAWCQIMDSELDEASLNLDKALDLDYFDKYVWGNKAIVHLLRMETYKANRIFTKYKPNDKLTDGRKWKEVVAEDLLQLENKGLGNDHFSEVRAILKIKK